MRAAGNIYIYIYIYIYTLSNAWKLTGIIMNFYLIHSLGVEQNWFSMLFFVNVYFLGVQYTLLAAQNCLHEIRRASCLLGEFQPRHFSNSSSGNWLSKHVFLPSDNFTVCYGVYRVYHLF